MRHGHLRLQRRREAGGADARVPFGIAGEGEMAQAVLLDHPGRQQFEAVAERP